MTLTIAVCGPWRSGKTTLVKLLTSSGGNGSDKTYDDSPTEKSALATQRCKHVYLKSRGQSPIVLVDTPGHPKYFEGALLELSQADAVLVVFDSQLRVGQKDGHDVMVAISTCPNITDIAIVINMSENRHNSARDSMLEYLAAKDRIINSLKESFTSQFIKTLKFMPLQGCDWWNPRDHTSSVQSYVNHLEIEHLEHLKWQTDKCKPQTKPQMLVSKVAGHGNGKRIFLGRTVGSLKVGDQVVFLCSRESGVITNLEVNHARREQVDADEHVGVEVDMTYWFSPEPYEPEENSYHTATTKRGDIMAVFNSQSEAYNEVSSFHTHETLEVRLLNRLPDNETLDIVKCAVRSHIFSARVLSRSTCNKVCLEMLHPFGGSFVRGDEILFLNKKSQILAGDDERVLAVSYAL